MFNIYTISVICDTQQLKLCSEEQKKLLSQMTKDSNFADQTMNLFKLKIYQWNVHNARKHYRTDQFCNDYCVNKHFAPYGCSKRAKSQATNQHNSKSCCPFIHSLNIVDLIFDNSNCKQEQDYEKAKLLCLYLMYKKNYNNTNAALFNRYGYILKQTANEMSDYLKSEKYYLKALSIDNKYSNAHNNYAALLTNELNNKDKAEYHFKQALKMRPTNVAMMYNFARLLISQKKYCQSLKCIENAITLSPNGSQLHYCKGEALFYLNKFEQSLQSYQTALKSDETDKKLSLAHFQAAREQIELLQTKLNSNDNINIQHDPETEKNYRKRKIKKLMLIAPHVTSNKENVSNNNKPKQESNANLSESLQFIKPIKSAVTNTSNDNVMSQQVSTCGVQSVTSVNVGSVGTNMGKSDNNIAPANTIFDINNDTSEVDLGAQLDKKISNMTRDVDKIAFALLKISENISDIDPKQINIDVKSQLLKNMLDVTNNLTNVQSKWRNQ